MTETTVSLPLTPGLTHGARMIVLERHTVPAVDPSWPGFTDMPPVLATAMMVGFVEQTCVEALRPFLATGQGTVGTHVDISHVAATPVGLAVTAEVELISIDGRTLTFSVSCHDEAGQIGQGLHRRAIVDFARFMERLSEKTSSVK